MKLVVIALSAVAVYQLWQLPANVLGWAATPLGIFSGVLAQLGDLISVPLLVLYLTVANGKFVLEMPGREWLAVSVLCTGAVTLFWWPSAPFWAWYNPDWTIAPWMVFFFILLSDNTKPNVK